MKFGCSVNWTIIYPHVTWFIRSCWHGRSLPSYKQIFYLVSKTHSLLPLLLPNRSVPFACFLLFVMHKAQSSFPQLYHSQWLHAFRTLKIIWLWKLHFFLSLYLSSEIYLIKIFTFVFLGYHKLSISEFSWSYFFSYTHFSK